MILNQAALKRQVTVIALLVIIVIAGIYCYLTLPRESFPDITIPVITQRNFWLYYYLFGKFR